MVVIGDNVFVYGDKCTTVLPAYVDRKKFDDLVERYWVSETIDDESDPNSVVNILKERDELFAEPEEVKQLKASMSPWLPFVLGKMPLAYGRVKMINKRSRYGYLTIPGVTPDLYFELSSVVGETLKKDDAICCRVGVKGDPNSGKHFGFDIHKISK